MIHSLEIGKCKGFLLKIDLSKAYDRVDWGFLDRILEAFFFNARVRNIISQLVSTPSFVVMVNGTPFDFFKSSRGLQKGDPLSPILFIIQAEVLGRLIHFKRSREDLVDLKSSFGPLIFTHQQFMDDTILRGEALVREARNVKSILNTYSNATGKLFNLNKSLVFFFNTTVDRQRKIADILGCNVGVLPSIYLGLPLGKKPLNIF